MEKRIKKKSPEKISSGDIKTTLVNKYKEIFINKLTPQDLDDLKRYIKMQYDKEHGWNTEYKLKFELKLREYFHEEVLRRELASIEALLDLMDYRDLKK